MSAIDLNFNDLPDWQKSQLAYRRQVPTEIVAKPWSSSMAPTGSFHYFPRQVKPATGVTQWLADILESQAQPSCSLTTAEVPDALAEIRSAFGLNTAELAQVLHVTRQTIYNWAEPKSVEETNRQRIAKILELARQWNAIHPKPMGRIVSEDIDGTSLLALLGNSPLDEQSISRLFHKIADQLAAAEANRPPSASELIKKFGLEPLSESYQRRNLQSFLLAGRRGQ